MQQTLRPYVTAGIAIVGSGLIAATPVVTPPVAGPQLRDIALTTTSATLPELLAPWVAVYNQAAENATTLTQNYLLAPHVAFQQMLANQTHFMQQILNDPSSIPAVVQQIQSNLDAVLTGFTSFNASDATIASVNFHTLSGTDFGTFTFGHDALFNLLPQFLPADLAKLLSPVVDFLASPLSGIMIGLVGPLMSPGVALLDSIIAGDNPLQILASPLEGFLNGATLNLDFLAPLINSLNLLPSGTTIEALNFAFGGLLSTGSVQVGPYEVTNQAGQPVTVDAVGGSIFNSLGLTLNQTLLPIGPLEIASQGVGPIAALEGWDQAMGALLGSGWTGKGPVEVSPPWPGINFPTFEDGGAGPGAATDVLADLGGLLGFDH